MPVPKNRQEPQPAAASALLLQAPTPGLAAVPAARRWPGLETLVSDKLSTAFLIGAGAQIPTTLKDS